MSDEHMQMGMAAVADALNRARIEVEEYRMDAERYRWFRDECSQERRLTICDYATDGGMLEHHIDKGRCGLE